MKTPQKETKFSLYLSYSLIGIIFILDCFFVFGIFGGIPYVVGLIVLMWLLKPADVLWFSATCGGMAIAAFIISEDLSELSGLMNRFMAIFTMVAIAMLIKRHTDEEESRVEQQRHLNSVVEKRTEGLKQIVDQLDEIKIRLSESEELGHFGFWEFHPATQQMVWSNGVFAIYGFPITPQAPSMQEFLDQCHTEDMETLEQSIQYGLGQKKPYTVEYRLIMPDGSVKWIFNKGRPIVDKQGQVKMLVGTIQDVTSMKHSEESLHANRARYTTLFKSAAVGKVLMIPNKRILEVNRAFSEWIGYGEKALMKVPIEKLIHEDDRSMDNAYAREMISGEIEFYQKEKRFVRRDGTILWGLFSVAPVHDIADKITCFAVEVVDITAHKNTEMALKKAQESWHEAEEALTENEAARRIAENALKESEHARRIAEENLLAHLEGHGAVNTGHSVAHEAASVEAIRPSRAANGQEESIELFEDPTLISSAANQSEELKSVPLPLTDVVEEEEQPYEHHSDSAPEHTQVTDLELSATSGFDTEPAPAVDPTPSKDTIPSKPAGKSSRALELIQTLGDAEIDDLFVRTKDLMAVLELNGCYKKVSAALLKELGYADDDLDDQHFLNFIHQEDREIVHQHLIDLHGGSNVIGLRLRHLSKLEGFVKFVWDATVDIKRGYIYAILKPDVEFFYEPPSQVAVAPAVAEPVAAEPKPVAATPVVTEPVLPEPVLPEPVARASEARPETQPTPQKVSEPLAETVAEIEPTPEAQYAPEPVMEKTNPVQVDLSSPPANAPQPAAEPIIEAPPVQPQVVYQEPVAKPVSTEPPKEILPEVRQEPEVVRPPEPVLAKKVEPERLVARTAPVPSDERRERKLASKPKPTREVDWHRLADRMPFQLWMLGPDRSCRYVNKKVRDFTGLPFEQLEGTGWSKSIHPEDYRKYIAYYKNTFDKWVPMGCVYRLRRNDGIYRWVQESSIPIESANGSYEGYLVICMEIATLKALSTKFINAFDDAVNLVDLKSALKPCQREESQLVLEDSVKIADALIANSREVPNTTLARLIKYAGQRLLWLVNEIISFSQADKDAHDLLKRSVSLESILESTVEMLAPLRRDEGPRFQINYNDNDVRVKVDKVLAHRIFEILLRNLIQWAESRVITLDIVQRKGAGYVEIRHIGQVLSANFLDNLDLIYRADKTPQLQKKGGLELSMVKRLAQAMDGDLFVAHEAGVGPVISIRFDLAETAEADDTMPMIDNSLRTESQVEPAQAKQLTDVVEAIASLEAPPPAPAKIEEPVRSVEEPLIVEEPVLVEKPAVKIEEEILIHENGSNGKVISRHRVLVGETNSETQRLVRSLLQPYYDLTIVPSTDDLLRQAEESQFDLLLLDVHLQGGQSGVDVLRELRRRPQYTRTPAIAVAAGTSAMDQRELIDRAGFDGFLQKPYSIVELLETVERMIENG